MIAQLHFNYICKHMKSLINILRYVIPYWGFALLNVCFNILSVIFSLASLTLFVPVLNILFKTEEAPEKAANFSWMNFDSVKDRFYYEIGQIVENRGEMDVLLYISITIVILFFLKNLFRYLAMFYLAPIRNGVVKDLRNKLYHKTLVLPLSYFSEQKKGDIIARMSGRL
jgi:ATP-binding cassette, subfamily B, bacterial MsbA